MYCQHCGEFLPENAQTCPGCNAPVAPAATPASPAPAADAARRGHDVASFEYTRTTVARDLVTVATDCYESLGWELTSTEASQVQPQTTLAFRRSRKVTGKAQLIKLQRRVDDLVKKIADLESSKRTRATMAALILGIPAALVLGAGMAMTMVWGGGLMAAGIVVGVVGLAGCAAAWPLYRSTFTKEAANVGPQVEAAYDELAGVCEEAQALLRAGA